ncbi:hypothetical protein [Tabrizicola fusiformis]|uniref:hypothetical protein n=1 Tax=Tabrizicola sp. SY72 TaxID=2741673 RepID=UPI001571A5E9|nr:hypothetical protein [Tabrizicola sp. SY72]NTT88357.1 hypothetical protein [Tabrizicola sp. SY72]
MLRLFALLCSLALILAPLAPSQAQSGCAMVAAAGMHAAHGTDHQMPVSGHPAQTCKQLCAVVAILIPPVAVTTPFVTVRTAPLRVARLIERERPDPSERPPKGLV